MPWFLRDIIYWLGSKSLRLFKNKVGTVTISAVGCSAKGMAGAWVRDGYSPQEF